ncbi:MAG: GatB/YqeY domain-containing protein [Patescibacteria group bacterium]|nr:GatB/YqeY domain-containing protein [Patescibacteria group bacterium]
MLREQIQQSLIAALKEKNEARVLTLRGITSALQNKEIELKGSGKDMQESDVLDVLKKELKKRMDAAQLYTQGGRDDLGQKELAEADIIKEFLPRMLEEEEVRALVDGVMASHAGATQKEMGMIIKEVSAKANGAADGSLIARLVKERLGA